MGEREDKLRGIAEYFRGKQQPQPPVEGQDQPFHIKAPGTDFQALDRKEAAMRRLMEQEDAERAQRDAEFHPSTYTKVPKPGMSEEEALFAPPAPPPRFQGLQKALSPRQGTDNGMLEPGNINLNNRLRVKNADGTTSTVRSMGVNMDGQEVLIPTVSDDGRVMADQEAIEYYKKTGRHLGKFQDVNSSNAYAESLHNNQAKLLGRKGR
jgi:lipoprotein-anchoring transpeptidase ErfK/SrfK